ncbi:54S ribosomal protein L11, mitochondrial [Clonorchis sinensis]|uniref:Large ribosomal subunit protein uL11m n=1 Tax=Clonorchis sinensis TaxID=79923 RepID=A0A8T1MD96_CLOSI|nr:54S ribosomal protein L11, mitochondrial [Clonorchis sinensis]
MASRAASKIVRKTKSAVDNVIHPPYLRVDIPAQQARPAPPLGPQLGKRNINVANFCKDFNEKTKDIKEGTPIPCHITVNPDRSYKLEMTHPPSVYLLRLARPSERSTNRRPSRLVLSTNFSGYDLKLVELKVSRRTEVCGRLTLKHIYHIAEMKKQDPKYVTQDLKKICTTLIGKAHRLGIEVISKEALDSGQTDHSPAGYAEFLKKRDQYLEEKKKTAEEKKQAKMLRL